MRRWAVLWGMSCVLFLLQVVPLWAAEEMTIRALKGQRSEEYERDVDQVAAAAQEQSISKLIKLLKKYRNTPQEPVLLYKLAELQQQYTAIVFRIGHGYAKKLGGSDLSKYQKATQETITTLNVLIKKYPHFEFIPRAYFMRAKSYEEVAKRSLAVADYSFLVNNFPGADDTYAAYMALADVAIEANDHPKAIQYLSEVEKAKDDPHFPFALYKLGWSHYNLKNFSKAISFLERHVEYYRTRKDTESVASDAALAENSYLDIVLFFFGGYEDGGSGYRLSDALPYFRRLEPGSVFGRMFVKFTKLLRAHGHEADMKLWKDQVLASESTRPEALEVVLLTYEYHLNKHRYYQLVEHARDYIPLYVKSGKDPTFADGFVKAQNLLTKTAEELHAIILKNAASDEVKQLSQSLAGIYDTFTRVVEETDPRVPGVHYNLAETLFAIKDFDGATEHYRWVTLHRGKKPKAAEDAPLKAVASRYEVLKQKRFAGVEVKAQAAPDAATQEKIVLDPLLSQWITWVDQLTIDPKKQPKLRESQEGFLFEVGRALYAAGKYNLALERFKDFALDHPKSTFAIPSATLVVDTVIAASDWQVTYDLTQELLDEKAWLGTEFFKRISVLAEDSFYKVIEGLYAQKLHEDVLKRSAKFMKLYPKSPRRVDVLGISARTALALSDNDLAKTHYTSLLREFPESGSALDALLGRAALAEGDFDVALASADYRKMFLSTHDKFLTKHTNELRKKTLFLTWLAGETSELRVLLNTKTVCVEALVSECERYAAWLSLSSRDRLGGEEETDAALKKVKKASGAEKALWAAVALEGSKNLPYRDRLYLVRQVSTEWGELDPLFQIGVLPSVVETIVKAFVQTRQELPKIAPLRANERHIRHRVDVIREIENAATKAMKLPWSRVTAEVLNQVAWLYLDLSREIAALPPPKDLLEEERTTYEDTIRKLVLPFEEKGQQIREKAFNLASIAMIEREAFRTIAEPFFAENPSLAKRIRSMTKERAPGAKFPAAPELDLEFARQLIPAEIFKTGQQAKLMKQWMEAIRGNRPSAAAFFLAEAKQKKIFEENILGVLRSVSLFRSKAQAEGLSQLDAVRDSLPVESGSAATLALVSFAVDAFAQKKAKNWLSDLKLETLNSKQKGIALVLTESLAVEDKKH